MALGVEYGPYRGGGFDCIGLGHQRYYSPGQGLWRASKVSRCPGSSRSIPAFPEPHHAMPCRICSSPSPSSGPGAGLGQRVLRGPAAGRGSRRSGPWMRPARRSNPWSAAAATGTYKPRVTIGGVTSPGMMLTLDDPEVEALARELLCETIERSGWYPDLQPRFVRSASSRTWSRCSG